MNTDLQIPSFPAGSPQHGCADESITCDDVSLGCSLSFGLPLPSPVSTMRTHNNASESNNHGDFNSSNSASMTNNLATLLTMMPSPTLGFSTSDLMR